MYLPLISQISQRGGNIVFVIRILLDKPESTVIVFTIAKSAIDKTHKLYCGG